MKVAVITGAARGIGKEIALLLAASGFSTVHADINYAGVKETAEEAARFGAPSLAVDLDAAEPESIENMIERTIGKFGRIDVLINNAAYVQKQPFLDYTYSEWKKTIDISLNGYFYSTLLAAREMSKTGGGKIINIASMVGFIPHGGLTAYSAAKAGVIAMTKLAANELKKHNITVNAIAPGPTDTPLMTKVINEKGSIPSAIIESAGVVAKTTLLLVNDDSNLINGNTINTGGGVLG